MISNGYRTILRARGSRRWARWTGELRVDGTTIAVDPSTWLGSRDRSWGIRPVGEAERPAAPPTTPRLVAVGSGGSTCRCASTTSRSS